MRQVSNIAGVSPIRGVSRRPQHLLAQQMIDQPCTGILGTSPVRWAGGHDPDMGILLPATGACGAQM